MFNDKLLFKINKTNFSRFLSGVILVPFLSFIILVEFLPFRSLRNDSLNDFLNDFLLDIGVSPAVDKSINKEIYDTYLLF